MKCDLSEAANYLTEHVLFLARCTVRGVCTCTAHIHTSWNHGPTLQAKFSDKLASLAGEVVGVVVDNKEREATGRTGGNRGSVWSDTGLGPGPTPDTHPIRDSPSLPELPHSSRSHSSHWAHIDMETRDVSGGREQQIPFSGLLRGLMGGGISDKHESKLDDISTWVQLGTWVWAVPPLPHECPVSRLMPSLVTGQVPSLMVCCCWTMPSQAPNNCSLISR